MYVEKLLKKYKKFSNVRYRYIKKGLQFFTLQPFSTKTQTKQQSMWPKRCRPKMKLHKLCNEYPYI